MEKIVTNQIDDRDPAVVYLKSGRWSQQASSAAFNDTLTLTQEKGATATLTFQGLSCSPKPLRVGFPLGTDLVRMRQEPASITSLSIK